jgi:GMP synthase-like glutamine amidotransferase
MRIHYLQHVPFEDAANIHRWAAERGHLISRTCLYEGEPLPSPSSFDWLVVMGGPMNVHEHEAYPWLLNEKAFIKEAIARGTFVLGVCLGAQLAADVLGGRVTANSEKEIGWFQVALTDEAVRSPFFSGFPTGFVPLHWHGDTFSIPPGAVRLAQSEACANQAFQFEDHVIGLQFHLDYSSESIEKMIRHCGHELADGPFIQRAEDLLPQTDRIESAKKLLYTLLDGIQEQLAGRVNCRAKQSD